MNFPVEFSSRLDTLCISVILAAKDTTFRYPAIDELLVILANQVAILLDFIAIVGNVM